MWLTLVLLSSSLQLTSYRSVPNQTDSSPYHTSTGEHVHKYGIAASWDLMCPMCFSKNHKIRMHSRKTCNLRGLHYGQWLMIPGYGLRVVNDVMNRRHHKALDLWVGTYAEEKSVGVRHTGAYVVQGV